MAELGLTGLGETHVELADGRRLQVTVDGAPDGPVVVVHHGTPSSAVFHPPWVADARERGLRLVSYARPGYGTSSRHQGRLVRDAVADTVAVADALGVDRFLTWGISGGGPHALACAALLPDRVVAAACLAGVGPFDADDLDFLDGMGEGNIAEFGLVINGGEAALRPVAEQELAGLAHSTVDEAVAAMAPFLTEVDAAAMRGPLGETMVAQARDAGRTGPFGWIDDDLAFVQGWGFELAETQVPVLLWQGRHDAMVPLAHGRWLADHIPGVQARLSETDGHLTLLSDRIPEVHSWLRQRWDEASA